MPACSVLNTKEHYYPFGSVMTARTWNSGADAYGFNGKRKDDEMYGQGNEYDFGARIYDPRLGKWMSVDPHAVNYAPLSPYNFVANTPILFVDEDGRDIGVSKAIASDDKKRGFVQNTFNSTLQRKDLEVSINGEGEVAFTNPKAANVFIKSFEKNLNAKNPKPVSRADMLAYKLAQKIQDKEIHYQADEGKTNNGLAAQIDGTKITFNKEDLEIATNPPPHTPSGTTGQVAKDVKQGLIEGLEKDISSEENKIIEKPKATELKEKRENYEKKVNPNKFNGGNRKPDKRIEKSMPWLKYDKK